MMPMSPTTGKVGGEVKLSVSYRNGNLFIMVMHIRDLVSVSLPHCQHFSDFPVRTATGSWPYVRSCDLMYNHVALWQIMMSIRFFVHSSVCSFPVLSQVSEDGTDPNPYVKTYLLPDPHKTTKRKTKISRKTRNPTFNEMVSFSDYAFFLIWKSMWSRYSKAGQMWQVKLTATVIFIHPL